MDETTRHALILKQQADPRIDSFLTEVETTRATLETTRAELEASGVYTPQGIAQRLDELRTSERERLEKAATFLGERSTNLEKSLKRSEPTPPEPLPPEQANTLLTAYASAPQQQRTSLLANLHNNQSLARAIAAIPEDQLWAHPHISQFTFERAHKLAHGAQRDKQGNLQYPNSQEHEKVSQARQNHLRAITLINSI